MTDQEIEERIGWLEAYRSGVEKCKNDNWSYPSLSCDGVGSIIELLRMIPTLRARITELESTRDRLSDTMIANAKRANEMQTQRNITREMLLRLVSFAATCRINNTSEWMYLLEQRLNAACNMAADSTRFAFSGDAFYVDDAALTPQETKDGQ